MRPQLVVGFIVPVNFVVYPMSMPTHRHRAVYGSRFVRQAWAAGYNVIIWTVDDEQQMRDYMEAAVDGIITDRPDLAVAARTDIARTKVWPAGLSDAIARSARSDEQRCSGLRLHQREQDRVTDSQAGQVHDQPVDTQAHAAGWRHPYQGLQEILVDLHRLGGRQREETGRPTAPAAQAGRSAQSTQASAFGAEDHQIPFLGEPRIVTVLPCER